MRNAGGGENRWQRMLLVEMLAAGSASTASAARCRGYITRPFLAAPFAGPCFGHRFPGFSAIDGRRPTLLQSRGLSCSLSGRAPFRHFPPDLLATDGDRS